jgi:Tfp pilus assembly protein PilF
MRFQLAFCCVVVGLGLAAAHASPPDDDPRAARELRQLPRSVPAAQAALRASELALANGDRDAAKSQLETALAHDPLNPVAHFAAARRSLASPAVAWHALWQGIQAAFTGFPNQLASSLNLYLFVFWSIVLGLVGTAGAIVFRYVRHVHHSLYEALSFRVGRNATVVAAALLLVPLMWGIGLIPTLAFFLLWFAPILRRTERVLVPLLAVASLVIYVTHELAPGPLAPPGPGHQPYRVALAMETGGSPGYSDDLDVVEPAGYVEWARGIIAKRSGDLVTAERELSRAASLLPHEYGVATDLGNVLFALGRPREAEQLYVEASKLEVTAPEPHYNRAQVLNERVDFVAADAAMKKATDLGYQKVSTFGATHGSDANHAVMDVLPRSERFWTAVLAAKGVDGRVALPAGLRILVPGGRTSFLPAGLIVAIVLGLVAGTWLRRSVRTFACVSCDRIVCRRCLVRIDGQPYCRDCGQTLSADSSAEFSRALVDRYFRPRFTPATIASGVVRAVLPGCADVNTWPVARSVLVFGLSGAALLIVSLRGALVESYPPTNLPVASDPLMWVVGCVIYLIARALAWRWRREPVRERRARVAAPPGARAA